MIAATVTFRTFEPGVRIENSKAGCWNLKKPLNL